MVFTPDVTDQVKSKFRLKEADEMTSMAISAAKLGAWHIETVEKALTYTTTLARIFSYMDEEPMTYEQAIPQVTEEFRPKILSAIDSDGNYSVFSGFVMDITEQKQDEQRKNDFIEMVSHELKTLLTSRNAIIQMAGLN